MKITILTVCKSMYDSFLDSLVVRKAIEKNLLEIEIVDIRNYSLDKHRHVDDTPYGGGAGMLMKVDVVNCALSDNRDDNSYVLLTSPKANPLKQDDLKRLLEKDNIVIICGHYEGIDARIEDYVDEKVNIGDYILTGGELPSMVIVDGLLRLMDDVIAKDSLIEETFNNGLLEYPQYTRPYEYDNKVVPEVLTNGNHEEIRKYNLMMSLKETYLYRPDLLNDRTFTKEELEILEKIKNEL